MSALEVPSFFSVLVACLRGAGCVFAEEEAQLLLDGASTPSQLQQMVDRRLTGEPLEHIVGWVQFCGRRIAVAPGVFVPRRRTEFLVHRAVESAPGGSVVADLCCGSGAVAASIGQASQRVELWAADLDPVAIDCARGNLGEAANLLCGDLFEPLPDALRAHLDLIVASAPYVPTRALNTLPSEARLHEPTRALDGGPDGLAVYRALITEASRWLTPRGSVLIEVGRRQAVAASELFAQHGFAADIHTCDDLGSTVVQARLEH